MTPGPVIVDANLLLLLVVGAADRAGIARHKRLASDYSVEDFDRVSALAAAFSDVVVLPNTLTEVSNLARQSAGPLRARIQATLRAFADGATEVYVASRAAAARDEFPDLGLTDAAILELCALPLGEPRPTLLSADADLINRASALGCACIDYNALR